MTYHLVESIPQLEGLIKQAEQATEIGLDTETNGLDTRRAKIAGISFSWAEGEAAYVPLGHSVGDNLPKGPVIERLKGLFDTRRALFYNAKFDLNILQVNTGWAPTDYLDVLELVYLADPDRKVKNLKAIALEELLFEMEKFEDLFTPEERKQKDFRIDTKMPRRCTDYACADADATRRLRFHYDQILKEQDFAVKIDTKLVEIVRKMEHNGGLVINEDYINEQLKALVARKEALKEQIFRMIGYRFELGSPKQLGIALFEKAGIPNAGMTRGKNPIYSTTAEVLEKLAKRYPIAELIISYRKVEKAESSYFLKLKRLAAMKIPVRFNFNMYAAPTFRFAAPGGDPERDGGCGVNIQAVSNGESRDVHSVDLAIAKDQDDYVGQVDEDELFFEDETDAILTEEIGEELAGADLGDLPWVLRHEDDHSRLFCIRETCAGCPMACKAKGIDTTRRLNKGLIMVPSVRQAFAAPEGYTMVSFDYDRQELVIGANMSGEPKWLRALAEGEDLHVSTAATAYGMSVEQFMKLPKEEFKRKRGVGKTLNFATFYGATAYTLANKADISTSQAEAIYDGFKRGHPVLFGWINKCHIFSRKNGYTTTYFGRKRSLAEFYKHPDRKIHAFADRSAVNTAIQGTAAEVTRIAMVKTDAALKKANLTRKEVAFVQQIHDELSFIVRDELVEAVVPIIKSSMEFNVKSWQVQLTVGAKAGKVWGLQKELKLAA